MRVNLQQSGLFKRGAFNAWSTEKRKAVRAATRRGMQKGGFDIRDAVREQMRNAFKVKSKGFVLSMKSKIIDGKKHRLPALYVGSKIPWLGIHTRGGTIHGNMLIPLLDEGRRMGPKKFRAVINGLINSGNAFFIKKGDKVILMAENIKENTRQLTQFKRAERQRTGAKSIKRGQEIPIAVLVKKVTLRRRLNMERAVQRTMPKLVQKIERELAKIR